MGILSLNISVELGAIMKYRLPPLLALRAFEASARHLSFTKAGTELHLTQGAISRHIRILESFLGHPLFLRLTRKIELTQLGQEYFSSVQQALTLISKATNVATRDTHRVLTLDVLPSLATYWLIPRLSDFTERHRDIEVRLVSSIEPVDLLNNEADVAIRVGKVPNTRHDRRAPRIDLNMTDSWNGLHIEPLFPDVLVPIVSRGLVDQVGPIEKPADVLKFRLINMASRRYAWIDWLACYDLQLSDDIEMLDFGHFFMALQAAKHGKGVALVPRIIFEKCDNRGDLFMPLAGEFPSAGAYYLLAREDALGDQAVRLLCEWIAEEAGQLTQSAP
ncbi:LysR family transcriptional regulator [Caballeronia arvi]|uniref:LysR family transcriptional regulator n=1 Tax=Caballeronia arvi TaxID=1777135 RepID=A0A158KJU7_9BURK|nr:LysR substrate-binding domain-containing protein [Caballeronia arvi]SAL80820.1 LysR family transcriptional regulator [Caballeronia arvi]